VLKLFNNPDHPCYKRNFGEDHGGPRGKVKLRAIKGEKGLDFINGHYHYKVKGDETSRVIPGKGGGSGKKVACAASRIKKNQEDREREPSRKRTRKHLRGPCGRTGRYDKTSYDRSHLEKGSQKRENSRQGTRIALN